MFATCVFATTSFAQDAHTTNQFRGVKVNGGTVTHSKEGDRDILTLSMISKSRTYPTRIGR